LESKNSKLAELEAQNEILRKQLGIGKLNNKKDLIAGQVIGSSPTSFREVLVVDKGRNDGVKKGDSVVSNKFLLGKVEKVYPHSSHIQLITSTDSVVNGLIQETRARGIVKGQIGYGLKMESIPKQAKIEAGQRVITSGLGGGFPKGLIIGYIDETISSEGDIFSSANLTNPINFYDLEIVFILSDK
jgi:rod shape-determining protein MreC